MYEIVIPSLKSSSDKMKKLENCATQMFRQITQTILYYLASLYFLISLAILSHGDVVIEWSSLVMQHVYNNLGATVCQAKSMQHYSVIYVGLIYRLQSSI